MSLLGHRVVPQAGCLQGPAATAVSRLSPPPSHQSRSCSREVPVLVKLTAEQAGTLPPEEQSLCRGTSASQGSVPGLVGWWKEASLKGLAVAGSQENSREGCMVVGRLMESNINGTYQF